MDRKSLLEKIKLDRFIALDFETTGLSIEKDRIIEVAAILFENGEPAKRFVSLVKPILPIPKLIEGITGITNEEVFKAINSQLWEVAIHRVKRSFESVHQKNTFTAGNSDEFGKEIITELSY